MLQFSSWLDFVLSASFLVLPRTTCPGNGAINSELGPPISNNNQNNLPQTSKCDLRMLSAENPFSGNICHGKVIVKLTRTNCFGGVKLCSISLSLK